MTDQLRRSAEMALEALEGALSDDKPYIKKSVEAIGFLRQALAQPEQDEGVDGSVRVFIKRDGEWERVDSYEKALKTLENIYWGKP